MSLVLDLFFVMGNKVSATGLVSPSPEVRPSEYSYCLQCYMIMGFLSPANENTVFLPFMSTSDCPSGLSHG